MEYFTQRNGLRKNTVEKTYDISADKYEMLFDCCRNYFNNIAWKYPEYCKDSPNLIIDLDIEKLSKELRYEIPDLFQRYGVIDYPRIINNVFTGTEEEEYDQYALLDFIEYMAHNCRDVEKGGYHSFYRHYHLKFRQSQNIFKSFQRDINTIFDRTGLLYTLTDDKKIERVVENDVCTPEIEESVQNVHEQGLKDLLTEAIAIHKSHGADSAKNATEKIWDAFERLKTYYTDLDKKKSAEKLVSDMAGDNKNYSELFDAEFRALTSIGNNFRIRHHETDKIDINDDRYYDYFFNRCLSLIALAIQYLE